MTCPSCSRETFRGFGLCESCAARKAKQPERRSLSRSEMRAECSDAEFSDLCAAVADSGGALYWVA